MLDSCLGKSGHTVLEILMAKTYITNEDETVRPTKRILRGIRQATKAAYLSDGRQRVGAAVYNGSSCVSTASNTMYKTHPKSADVYEWPYPHAEWNALNGLSRGYDPKNLTVYIVRLLHDETTATARPCRECHKYLLDLGVKAIYYTDLDGVIKKMGQGLPE